MSDETIAKACNLATLPASYHDKLDTPVGKQGRKIRVVDRAAMTIARALLSGVDLIVMNRTEAVFSAGTNIGSKSGSNCNRA